MRCAWTIASRLLELALIALRIACPHRLLPERRSVSLGYGPAVQWIWSCNAIAAECGIGFHSSVARAARYLNALRGIASQRPGRGKPRPQAQGFGFGTAMNGRRRPPGKSWRCE